jgi:transcriptional regulator with XRE-family HTH domain
MRSALHNKTAQAALSANLKAAFAKRKLSARGVAKAIGPGADGKEMSNKTVSNLVNGVGAPQFDTLTAVAEYLHIPIWQLLCPQIDPSHFGNQVIHELVESFCSLSEIGRARLLQNLEDAVIAEHVRHPSRKRNVP